MDLASCHIDHAVNVSFGDKLYLYFNEISHSAKQRLYSQVEGHKNEGTDDVELHVVGQVPGMAKTLDE